MSIGIVDILAPEHCLVNQAITSKKKLLEFLGDYLTQQLRTDSSDDVYERLLTRERMGSTGIGEGVAIPHCRLKQCQQAFAVLLTLPEAIDFDAIDNRPVDLIFTLVVPEEATDEHLQLLAVLAGNFSNAEYRQALRNAPNNQQLYQRAISQF